MNERIKELIVQSENGQFHNGKCYPHIGSRTIEDWEKFAELIVRECMKLNHNVLCEDDPDYLDEVYKAHFGVE